MSSQAQPVRCKLFIIKIIYSRKENCIRIVIISFYYVPALTVSILNKPGFPACNRPAVFPNHGNKKSLTTHVTKAVSGFAVRAGSKAAHPPFIFRTHKVCMPNVANTGSISKMSVSQNRIRRFTLPLAVNCIAAGNTNRMIRSGSALRMQKIILTVYLVDMRTFRPHTVFQGTPPDSF